TCDPCDANSRHLSQAVDFSRSCVSQTADLPNESSFQQPFEIEPHERLSDSGDRNRNAASDRGGQAGERQDCKAVSAPHRSHHVCDGDGEPLIEAVLTPLKRPRYFLRNSRYAFGALSRTPPLSSAFPSLMVAFVANKKPHRVGAGP